MAFVTSSQVVPMLLVRGPHFENCCSRRYPAPCTYANFWVEEQPSLGANSASTTNYVALANVLDLSVPQFPPTNWRQW